jgi:hypothetical protein
MTRIFDSLGKAITSLAAVIFVMLMTIAGMILFSHTLFLDLLPAGMATWEKIVATWVIACSWELTVLITTVNTKHLNKNVPAVMAVCSGIIVLFFIQGFDGSVGWLIIVQRWFVSILVATINWIYADLFWAKWCEFHDTRYAHKRVDELQEINDALNRALIEKTKALDELQRSVNETAQCVNELKKFKAKIERELTCPHCKVIHENFGTLHAHKRHCSDNPINKDVLVA